MGRSPLRLGFFLLASLAVTANAQIKPPVCPSKACSKVITFYNNTPNAIYPVIQAGIQSPDPWLQALFNDNSKPYAETHYSRAYVNPKNGILPGMHVSVTVPWYSTLKNDKDTYIDWYNGCRIFFFDSIKALNAAHNADKNSPLSYAANSPLVSCDSCELPLTIYKDTLAFPPSIPFQLVEYTFADVKTPKGVKPSIIDLNVGYNVSFLDQIYLPVALAPCRTEPCNRSDPTAFGFLGTTQKVPDFRSTLTTFSNQEGWPRYKGSLDDPARPRLPGTYNVLIDRVNVIVKGQPSAFTPLPPGSSVSTLIDQWKTCTTSTNPSACPQYTIYQEIDKYFKGNYNAYKAASKTNCPPSPKYPLPANLTDKNAALNIMPNVYGWVPFNSGCIPPSSPDFNSLLTSPGPKSAFDRALFDYIHSLQYNYRSVATKQRFNPFVALVHDKLKANGYAFSVDDAISFENHPGEGLIIAIGGATGLPNPRPVVPPPDYTADFSVSLGDSKALKRPMWKSFGVCKDVADTNFPPLPPDAKVDSPQIIVDTKAYKISPTNPCKITVTDASNRKYQFTVRMAVPWPTWPAHNPPAVDAKVVVSCVNTNDPFWCKGMNELAIQAPNPQFVLFTPPPPPLKTLLGAPAPPDVRQELRVDLQALRELSEIDVPHETSVRRWLEVEIAVLQARMTYPNDEVLEQLDQMLHTRTTLGRKAKRRILAQLDARVAELQGGP
jgi:hypothetical protein